MNINQKYLELVRLITRDHSIPIEIAKFSLTPTELGVFDCIAEASKNTIDIDTSKSIQVKVTRKNYKISLHLEDPIIDEGTEECFDIPFSKEMYSLCVNKQETVRAILESKFQEVNAYLDALAQDDRLDKLLDRIIEILGHFAPLVVYVKEDIYTSESYWGANLLDKGGKVNIMSQLKNKPLSEWSSSEKQFVFALDMLLLSGGVYRLEEMNGMQVDPISLEYFIDQKTAALSSYTKQSAGDTKSIQEKAKVLNDLQKSLESQHQYYRLINGACLNKVLKWFPLPDLISEKVPDELAQQLLDQFEVSYATDVSTAEYFQSVTNSALKSDTVKDLIETMIRAGLKESESDFFMSRGSTIMSIPENYNVLKKSQFYCTVLAREDLDKEKLGLADIATNVVRYNQSARMQFNGWKFWYGNLKPEEKSPRQYYFVPPIAPDIGYEEDRLHAGHFTNGVVNSVRVPGSLNFYDEVNKKSRRMVGSFDVRAVRSERSNTYSEADMVICMKYAKWFEYIYQTLANIAFEGNGPYIIDYFGKDYYEL